MASSIIRGGRSVYMWRPSLINKPTAIDKQNDRHG